MKKLSNLKETLLLVTFAFTIFSIASCSNSNEPKDTKAVAEKQNKERFDDKKQKDDAQFLVNAAEMNLEQVQLGQLAQEKGNATHVKELGKAIEGAHAKSQRDLTALAQSKKISIPVSATDDSKDVFKKLKEKSKDDFDKAYADLMVSNHKDAIKAFEKASTDSYDAEIKKWAKTTLPKLRSHLDRSKECQMKFADMLHLEVKR